MRSELEEQIAWLKPGDHLCLIYEDAAEQMAVITFFIKAGLQQDECCVYIADDNTTATVAAALAAAGVDIPKELDRGALVLLTKRGTYLRGGQFEPEAMIDLIRSTHEQARAAGLAGLRITGEMTWALGPGDSDGRLLETEARLNGFLAVNPALVLCAHQRRRVPPAVLRAHPVVILDRQVCSNPYYEPPGLLAGQAAETDRVAWMLGALQRRHQAEDELREREERYRRLVEDSHGLICTHDLAGTLLSVNAAAAALLGYHPDEMVGRNMAKLLAPSVRHLFGEYLARIRQAPADSGLLRVVTRDGDERSWVYRNVRIDGPRGRSYVLGHAQDITDRERVTKTRLETTLSLLQATLEATADGILVMDQTGKVVSFNRKFGEMWRLPEPVLASQDQTLALNCILEQVEDPAGFLSGLQELCNHPEAEGMDVLHFKDGRILERYSQPQRVGRKWMGRVFSFRDVTERKRAETALRESEERYRDLVENANDIVFTCDLAWNVTSLNRAGKTISGYTRNEALTMNIAELVVPEYHDLIRQMLDRKVREGGATTYEVELVAKDGHRIPLEVNTLLISKDGNPVGVQGIARDITERKRAEEALRESEDRYRDLVEHSHYLICTHDLEGKILSVNQAAAVLLGHAPSELVMKNIRNFLVPKARDGFDAYLAKIRSDGVASGVMQVQTSADERRIWEYHNTLRIEGVAAPIVRGVARDITERMRAQRELKRAEAARQALYQASLQIQEPLGLQERLNRLLHTAQTVLALDRVNILLADPEGRWLEAVATLGVEEPLAAIRVPIGPEGGALSQAYRTQQAVLWDDQGPVPAPLQLAPPYDQIKALRSRAFVVVPLIVQGRAIGVLGADRKHSRRPLEPATLELLHLFTTQAALAIEQARLYEEQRMAGIQLEATVEARTRELQNTNAKLQEATHRAEAASRHKSAFLANMSHELRTPLNSILGFSELLQQQAYGPLTPKQARYTDHIHSSGKHLLALINDLLDLSKVEAGRLDLRPEAFDLPVVLTAAVSQIRPQAEGKHLELSLRVDEAPSTLIADPLRFKQILFNLLSNAVKFTLNGGTITVTARRVPGSEFRVPSSRPQAETTIPGTWNLEPGTASGSGFVEISVQDTGIGIRAEDLPKLFQAFTQLQSTSVKQYQGTGLGLALTKRLVELHGGSIWAESAGEGQGSTFTIWLPMIPPDTTAGRRGHSEASSPPRPSA